MSKDFIHNNILQGIADAIRYCDDTTAGIAPVNYAERIRALDKLIPQPDALNFYMPNGGTISLNKIGSPTVVELEYSIDGGATWTVWPEDGSGNRSLTLTAGQRVYVRNTSETQTRFSTSADDYYMFSLTGTAESHGNINSLLCKDAESVTYLSDYCYRALFYNCTTLTTCPELPSQVLARYCYYATFGNCTSLVSAPILPAAVLFANCYRSMFSGCVLLSNVKTYMRDLATQSLYLWLRNVSPLGDFYCPAELTIATSESGIPSGWTRNDI